MKKEFFKTCHDYNQNNYRLNAGHLSNEKIREYIQYVNEYNTNQKNSFYLDLKGNKKRIGQLNQDLELKFSTEIPIILAEQNNAFQIPMPDPTFFDSAEIGDILLLHDGEIKLKIIKQKPNFIITKVLEGGLLRSRVGINFQNKSTLSDLNTNEMIERILLAKRLNIENIALSYIIGDQDIDNLRAITDEHNYHPRIIAKIECQEALLNLKEICMTADEIWFCRGDLGLNIHLKDLGFWQEKTINITQTFKKNIMIAGQVFHHLTEHSQPTRSEVIHFYNIQKQRVNGIILSDETAIGLNPTKAVKHIFSLM